MELARLDRGRRGSKNTGMFRRRRTGFFHVWALFRKIVGASEFTREVAARAGDVLGLNRQYFQPFA
jgi:hypothetical protein